MKREPKSERGALLLATLFSRTLTLVPHSFLLNHTETLATQATVSRIGGNGATKPLPSVLANFVAPFLPT